MGLHEEIAAVIDAASGRYEHADTDTIATDVMGVVTSHLDGRRAYTERRMEWAREAEARVWERRMREEKEAADAELVEQIVADEQKCQEAISADPTNPHLAGKLAGLQRARDIVLSRVGEISKEEQ